MPQDNPGKKTVGYARQFSLAFELPIVFVGAVGIGGAIGYGLDRWWHTAPWLMIAGGGLGFAAGLRELLRRLLASDGGN
jgi:ATP synthase protein I